MSEKEDPRRLELRAKPKPVLRLNRRLIAAGLCIDAGSGARINVGASQARAFSVVGFAREAHVERVVRAEGLESLPRDYAAIPKPPQLGAPIGELGRPVLRAEREAGIPELPERPTYRPDPEEDAIRAQRLREQSEADAASKAGVLIKLERHASTATPPPADGTAASDPLQEASAVERALAGLPRSASNEPTQQQRKQSFIDREMDSRIPGFPDSRIPGFPFYGFTAALLSLSTHRWNLDYPCRSANGH
jgi:type IV secretory pathway VirB10-like protein